MAIKLKSTNILEQFLKVIVESLIEALYIHNMPVHVNWCILSLLTLHKFNAHKMFFWVKGVEFVCNLQLLLSNEALTQ